MTEECIDMALNYALSVAGVSSCVDHRTLAAQGVDRLPDLHLGRAATTIEWDGLQ